VSEQPVLRVETTITRSGVNYEAAIMGVLIAHDMGGGLQLEPDADLAAWQQAAGRGTRVRLLPEAEPELEA
jgi:hypothetical protein